ncbi:TonB-dependent receptor [Leptospira gomenensis]|uniref:TonB-dependent receptor n=1 Tax=Leptospira gomenensis TaxID=2484974 RepID=A0A5F1Y8W6_9LEPT|nr:TonB-dependent receptor [Leptospira gomenensis]TGK31821.1 TonB-dependent receptor [Leptospira gomenensis]TGK41552.1 TonB-dependent receptor [Leptospira gomenensis]TGK41717.1 TonB-dependent receptor [Leptospira gomenensis]TGK61490.1 TonB-dependent receptor [Leptospira gomenensis]
MDKTKLYSEYSGIPEDDKRLIYASFLVLAIASFFTAHLLTRNMLWKILGSEPLVKMESNEEKEKIYEVLLEQDFVDKNIKDEYKALSNVDAAGAGGITKKEGFHSSSPFREFVMGSVARRRSEERQKQQSLEKNDEKSFEVGIYKIDPVQTSTSEESKQSTPTYGKTTKIPFNYRFEQDFLFRWDGNQALSIPRKKLAGYEYFKRMLKQIEGSFAPPGGGNYAYRDMAGTVVREGILPGQVKVLFMLSEGGQVLDTRLVTSQGQDVVSQACLDSIRGQNFGKVPDEVKAQGLIFGINFIFPMMRSR